MSVQGQIITAIRPEDGKIVRITCTPDQFEEHWIPRGYRQIEPDAELEAGVEAEPPPSEPLEPEASAEQEAEESSVAVHSKGHRRRS